MLLEKYNIVLPEKIIFGNLEIRNGNIYDIVKISEEDKTCSRYILAGLIDPHVHLRDPGLTDKEDVHSGTLAAIHGGVTTVFDMPNTIPPVLTIEEFEKKKNIFEEKAVCDWKLFFGVSENNLSELKKIDKNDPKLAGFKLFLGSSTGKMLVDEDGVIEQVFQIAKKKELIVSIHAELENLIKKRTVETDPSDHSKLRPPEAAAEAVKKSIDLSRKFGTRINICHTSTKQELDYIEQAKKKGLPVTCEVAPHHLFLSTEDYDKFKTLIQMNPPVRNKKETEKVWKHLQKGTVDMIATDHAPHLLEEKQKLFGEAPSGIPGLETSLPLMLKTYNEGRLNLIEISKLMSGNAAEIWNLEKGRIKKGEIADLIIIDFEKDWKIRNENLQTKCKWSPWNGFKTKGKLEKVIINGNLFELTK